MLTATRPIAVCTTLAPGLAPIPAAAAADMVGARTTTVEALEREQALTVPLRYPAGAGGTAERVGGRAAVDAGEDDGICRENAAARDAVPARLTEPIARGPGRP